MGFRLRLPSRTQISRWTVYSLFLGLFISFPVAVTIGSAPAAAASTYFTNQYDAVNYGGGGGGDTYRASNCPANWVVVGFSIAGTSGVGILCRALNADGTMANTPHTTSNSTKYNLYGSPATNVFCPTGKVATGFRIQANGYANGGGLLCETLPALQDEAEVSPLIAGSGDLGNAPCNDGNAATGAWAVTGAWLDRVAPRCSLYNLFTVKFLANGASGSASAPFVTQATVGGGVTLATQSTLAKGRSTFVGWNTAADGSGSSYVPGSSFFPNTHTTLYAQWTNACATGVGVGGPSASVVSGTKGGNGCIAIRYTDSNNAVQKEFFNYTGDTQTWTVPSGVTSVKFFAIGAAGGGSFPSGGAGGGGGFVIGEVAVNAGDVFDLIVGEGGGGFTPIAESPCFVTKRTFGGGGRGGSCVQGAYSGTPQYQAAGGGRSAVRLRNATEDLLTAAGGGGGARRVEQAAAGGGLPLRVRAAGGAAGRA